MSWVRKSASPASRLSLSPASTWSAMGSSAGSEMRARSSWTAMRTPEGCRRSTVYGLQSSRLTVDRRPLTITGRCSPLEALHRQGRVVSAEAERIAQRHLDRPFTHRIGRRVEVALGVGGKLVDGGRDLACPDRLECHAEFEGAGTAKQVAGHGLGGSEYQLAGVLAKDRLHRPRLGDVAHRRRGAVGVDVAHVLHRDPAVLEAVAERQLGALA